MKDIYTITKGCYRSFAEQIVSRLGRGHYISGVFSHSIGGVVHRLELTLIIYRDAGSGEIVDISDVWWDSYTIEQGESGEMVLKINDFDFALLCKQLIVR